MKNMRIPLIIVVSVAVLGIILGSFFDLQISSAIASPTSVLGLTISAICPTLGFAGVAVMGGGFIALAVHGKYPLGLKIMFYVLAACCYGVAVCYPAGEYFGVNGFYGAAPKWMGYLIVILPEAAAMAGGYFLFKDCENKNMWIVFVVIVGLLLLALLGVIPRLKDFVRRPRYRLVSKGDVAFHNWWQPCRNYKDLMAEFGIESSDDFKSYPSGHTAETSILLVVSVFFPMAHKKFAKYQLPMFLASCGLVLLVAFARILAAAHYLSDVSTGAFVIAFLLLIANEVLMRIKAVQLNEEPEQQEEPKEQPAE